MLSPGQQLWLDVGHFIRDQIPDSDGHTMPADTMAGSYELRDLDHATAGFLYEGKLIIDKTYGHATYGCATCCGFTVAYLIPDPFEGPTGIDFLETLQSTQQCGGQVVDLADDAFNWQSSNPPVATLPSKVLHTVAVGSATGSTEVTVQNTHPAPRCPLITYGPQQPIGVTPVISGPSAVWWFNGQNPDPSDYPTSVTLTSSGGSSSQWSVSQKDSKVKLSSTSGATITVNATGTNFSASVGDISFTVTASGIKSSPFTMTARTPWKLVPVSTNTVCYASPQTYGTSVSYNVEDNLSTVMSSDIYWNESLGTSTCQGGSNWCNYQIISGGADSNPLTDVLDPPDLNVTPAPSPTPSCSGQGSGTTLYRTIPQTIRVGSSDAGKGVQAQTDTLGYYKDHAQHNGIQSPGQPPQ